MSYNIGPKIGIDGEKEFRDQISKINDKYKALQAETRAVTAAFEAQCDEQGKLEALSKQLVKQIDEQQEKQALLEDAVKKASARFGENSIEATRLRGALYDTQATISTLESELKDTTTRLEHFGDAVEDLESDEELARKAMSQFQDQVNALNVKYKALESETKAVTKAFDVQGDKQGKLEALSKQLEKQIELQIQKQKTLESAVSKASDEFGDESIEATRLRGALYDTKSTISTLESELKDAKAQLDRAGNGMEGFKENTESAGKAAISFGDIVGANLVSDLVMDGIRELGGYLKDFAVGSIDAAADVKAANAQYEQTFGQLQEQASAALAQISNDVNIASTRMQGSFTKIYAFAKTAGADSATALTISTRAMVAAADSAAYYDRSIEDTTETLQAFLKGNYANDAALGISCTETQRNTKANELYAKSFKDLTEAQKVDTLLAMVEAGNEASGAIGQAARESDSWENVLGEVAEMLRQVQANAGQAALKKLTPVIQKITKAGYELIEDVDWDAFGDRVEQLIDGVIDYGPTVIKIIASIVAGVAAFKVAQKITQFASFAKSLLSVGTAAQTTGTAMASAGAAASATPWGAIAAAVGLAVTAFVQLSNKALETSTTAGKALKQLRGAFEDAEKTYADSLRETEAAAYAAEAYVDRLDELKAAGLNTAEAQEEYALIVEELNELIPDLNLIIDEQTGLLNKNTDEIRDNIDAWKDSATKRAIQDRFSDMLYARGEAIADLAIAEKELKALEDEISAQKEIGLGIVVHEDSVAYAQAKRDIEDLKQTIADYDIVLVHAEQAMYEYNETQSDTSTESDNVAFKQQQVREQLENLISAYSEAKDAAMESINSQIGYFKELSGECEWTTEKIMENWEKQNRAFSNYADNLLKAANMGLDKALIEQLSDGSEQSMLILNELVNDTKYSIGEINTAFSRNLKTRDTVAGVLASIQTDSIAKWKEIAEDAKAAGLQISEGAADGLIQNSWKFVDAIANMAKSGQNWWNNIWGIHSPSRWMSDGSEFIVAGGVNTIDRLSSQYAESLGNMARLGQESFLQYQLNIPETLPATVPTSTVNNSRTITNMGGFSINITQQPGESAENLAYRVMDIIQTEIDAKGAVFSA